MYADKIRQALVEGRVVCCAPDCVFSELTCSRYWRRVFKLFFDTKPRSDHDPRWDALFKIGYPAQRILHAQELGVASNPEDVKKIEALELVFLHHGVDYNPGGLIAALQAVVYEYKKRFDDWRPFRPPSPKVPPKPLSDAPKRPTPLAAE